MEGKGQQEPLLRARSPPATAGVLLLPPPPTVSHAFLSSLPLATQVFFSASDWC